MGLDLTLLPFDADSERMNFSHTVLSCERRGQLFEEIQELRATPVPEDFTSYLSLDGEYEEHHYGQTHETPYGEPLTYVLAGQLWPFASHEDVMSQSKNRAIWAYLAELPPDTKVALYWH